MKIAEKEVVYIWYKKIKKIRLKATLIRAFEIVPKRSEKLTKAMHNRAEYKVKATTVVFYFTTNCGCKSSFV